MESVTVFLVRHGEREDESRAYRRKTRADPVRRLDPFLTKEGYQQSLGSFTRLFDVLKASKDDLKIAVFCSPLRRTIGTALMMGPASSSTKLNASLVLPAKAQQADNEFPVTVMNGLCDCAAQIRRLGGVDNAASLIACADVPANEKTYENPITAAVSEMQQDLLRLSSSQSNPEAVKQVRFWRLHEGNSYPMTPPKIALNGIHPTPAKASPRRLEKGPQTFEALDSAVDLAAQAGCNVCIIVTHREAIQELSIERCGFRPDHPSGRLSTPYCCIASYAAQVVKSSKPFPAKDNVPIVRWTFYGVVHPLHFTTQHIPRPVAPCSPHREETSTAIVLLQMSGDENQSICEIASRSMQPSDGLDRALGCQLVLQSCPRSAVNLENLIWNEFRILDGRSTCRQALNLLTRSNQLALGVSSREASDGTVIDETVVFDWDQQPTLPCPPYTLVLGFRGG